MSRSPAIYVRSRAFNLLFYVNLAGHMIVALPTLSLPYRFLHDFIRSYALTSLWLCASSAAPRWNGGGERKFRKAHASLPASTIGMGDFLALRADRRSGLCAQARIDVDAAVRLVHAEGGTHSDRPLRRHGSFRAHDRAGAEGTRRPLPAPARDFSRRHAPFARRRPSYKPGIIYLYKARPALRAGGAQFRTILAAAIAPPAARHDCR